MTSASKSKTKSVSKAGPKLTTFAVDATVVIPTYNGEMYIRQILDALANQEFDGSFEVLVIDSGSSDGTLDIVRSFADVRLYEIPNREFGHGRTRNLAAELALGTHVAYLTHDAIPETPHWLREIIEPMKLDGLGCVAVMGKQVPRPGCFPLLKYEIEGVFRNFGPDFGTTIFYLDEFVQTQSELDAISFYSDVNSATRKDFLTKVMPYQDVPYSEDMAFGREIVEQGFRKAYAPRASVIHSNDLTLHEYRLRIFDEVVGMRRIGHDYPVLRFSRQVAYTGFGALRDSLRIVRDGSFSWRRKLYWLVVNPWFHVAKWRAYYRATRVDVTDQAAVATQSLEAHRAK
jgi:rhamnosyltransferase